MSRLRWLLLGLTAMGLAAFTTMQKKKVVFFGDSIARCEARRVFGVSELAERDKMAGALILSEQVLAAARHDLNLRLDDVLSKTRMWLSFMLV
jgi:hypothetical protein